MLKHEQNRQNLISRGYWYKILDLYNEKIGRFYLIFEFVNNAG